jgi:flagellar basal body-associated protein FliL
MEARRTFETGAKSSKQIWIVFVALLAVLALGMAGAYVAKALSHTNALTTNAPSSGQVMRPSLGSDPYSPRDSLGAPNASAGDPYSPAGK